MTKAERTCNSSDIERVLLPKRALVDGSEMKTEDKTLLLHMKRSERSKPAMQCLRNKTKSVRRGASTNIVIREFLSHGEASTKCEPQKKDVEEAI